MTINTTIGISLSFSGVKSIKRNQPIHASCQGLIVKSMKTFVADGQTHCVDYGYSTGEFR